MSVQKVESVIEEALDSDRPLIFNYHGENRRVVPEELLVTKNRNRVLVAIQDGAGYRRFSIDEISDIELV
mgnify:CR=1 FL=1